MSWIASLKKCSEPGCDETYSAHRWGRIAACELGWFVQKNDEGWCPQHVPAWVEEWRNKQNNQTDN